MTQKRINAYIFCNVIHMILIKPGTNPSLWPQGLDEFVSEIVGLKELSLYEERREILNEFFDAALKRINIEKNLKVWSIAFCILCFMFYVLYNQYTVKRFNDISIISLCNP